MCWVDASLRASTKNKKPTLVQFLLAVSGKTFEQREEVTGQLLNSFIGAPLRAATVVGKKKDGREYAEVTTFLAAKKG